MNLVLSICGLLILPVTFFNYHKILLHTFTNTNTFTITIIYFHSFIYITDVLTSHNPNIILNYLYLSLNKYRGFHLKFVQQNLEIFCTILRFLPKLRILSLSKQILRFYRS